MSGEAVRLVDRPRSFAAVWRWESALALAAAAAAGVAFWITLRAGFLAYPGWLAVQKADFILGPVGVGLYWRHRRPGNRLGLLLIALGVVAVPYIFESTTNPVLFGLGVLWEDVIALVTQAVILAFPNGRLDGIGVRAILAATVLGPVLPGFVFALTVPQYTPGFSISGCRAVCPANGLAIWSPPSWTPQLADYAQYASIAVALATAGLLVWRFLTGTPPRRRAMAIGGPIALLFLLTQATYRLLFLLGTGGRAPVSQPTQDVVQWMFAGARAAIWYGFLLALIAAELFAGRTLRRLVGETLRHPSFPELERMLRQALGDPWLRLSFWRPLTCDWAGVDGRLLEPPGLGQMLTRVDRGAEPAAAIVHDAQLAEDPELLRAAATVALLAAEHAELEGSWKKSLRALADSRAQIARAGDAERRKLERDLHDGAQQRLLAALIRVSSARELAAESPKLRATLTQLGLELEEAVEELRELARGIYPAVLADLGLAEAIRTIALRAAGAVTLEGIGNNRFSPEVEAAFYCCCLEAIQNASKHAGTDVHISIRLSADDRELHLEVCDDGRGFDTSNAEEGVGLQSMRDRIGAVGGMVEIVSRPERGTRVVAAVPVAALARLG